MKEVEVPKKNSGPELKKKNEKQKKKKKKRKRQNRSIGPNVFFLKKNLKKGKSQTFVFLIKKIH